jgi:hypothetical protein
MYYIISRASGENMDNSSMKGEFQISGEEDALIKNLTKEFAHTIVILNYLSLTKYNCRNIPFQSRALPNT